MPVLFGSRSFFMLHHPYLGVGWALRICWLLLRLDIVSVRRWIKPMHPFGLNGEWLMSLKLFIIFITLPTRIQSSSELKDEEKYGNQQIMSCLNKCYFSQIFNILVDRLKRADSGILDTLLADTSS